jgi:hypothetical protein
MTDIGPSNQDQQDQQDQLDQQDQQDQQDDRPSRRAMVRRLVTAAAGAAAVGTITGATAAEAGVGTMQFGAANNAGADGTSLTSSAAGARTLSVANTGSNGYAYGGEGYAVYGGAGSVYAINVTSAQVGAQIAGDTAGVAATTTDRVRAVRQSPPPASACGRTERTGRPLPRRRRGRAHRPARRPRTRGRSCATGTTIVWVVRRQRSAGPLAQAGRARDLRRVARDRADARLRQPLAGRRRTTRERRQSRDRCQCRPQPHVGRDRDGGPRPTAGDGAAVHDHRHRHGRQRVRGGHVRRRDGLSGVHGELVRRRDSRSPTRHWPVSAHPSSDSGAAAVGART